MSENSAGSLYSDVLSALRAKVISLPQLSREPLKVSEICDELKASTTPVREALAQLVGEGLVELEPHRGFRIVPISLSSMRGCYEILHGIVSHRLVSASLDLQADSAEMRKLAQRANQNGLSPCERASLLEDSYRVLVSREESGEALRIVSVLIQRTSYVRRKFMQNAGLADWMISQVSELLQLAAKGDVDGASERLYAISEGKKESLQVTMNEAILELYNGR